MGLYTRNSVLLDNQFILQWIMHALSACLLPAVMSRSYKCYYPTVPNTPGYISNSQICKNLNVQVFAAYITAVTDSFASPCSP
jgi:hypothetical protein